MANQSHRFANLANADAIVEGRGEAPDKGVSGLLMALTSVAASPDGKTILTGGEDRTARLQDVPTSKELRAAERHGDKVRCVALSPEGNLLLTGCEDTVI